MSTNIITRSLCAIEFFEAAVGDRPPVHHTLALGPHGPHHTLALGPGSLDNLPLAGGCVLNWILPSNFSLLMHFHSPLTAGRLEDRVHDPVSARFTVR